MGKKHLFTQGAHGGESYALAQILGINANDITDYSSNTHILAAPRTEQIIIRQAYPFLQYPDTRCTQLRERLSAHHSLFQSTSAQEDICDISKLVQKAPLHITFLGPMFSEYIRACDALQITYSLVETDGLQGFACTEEVLHTLAELSQQSICTVICSPNNPGGIAYPNLDEILQHIHSPLVVADLAYSQFLLDAEMHPQDARSHPAHAGTRAPQQLRNNPACNNVQNTIKPEHIFPGNGSAVLIWQFFAVLQKLWGKENTSTPTVAPPTIPASGQKYEHSTARKNTFNSLQKHTHQHMQQQLRPGVKLVTLHSLTKFYCCPGLRMGYLLAPSALVKELERHSPPWSISTFSQQITQILLDHTAEYTALLKPMYSLRDALYTALRSNKLFSKPEIHKGVCFISARLHQPDRGAELLAYLASHGQLVRLCDNIPGMPKGYIRIQARPEWKQLMALLDTF